MPWRDITKYPRSQARCTVYLLHFSKPYKHARHYVGVTTRDDLEDRVREHEKGRGAKLTKAAVNNGAELILARVWRGVPRYYEIKLKNGGGFKRLCPICKKEAKK